MHFDDSLTNAAAAAWITHIGRCYPSPLDGVMDRVRVIPFRTRQHRYYSRQQICARCNGPQ